MKNRLRHLTQFGCAALGYHSIAVLSQNIKPVLPRWSFKAYSYFIEIFSDGRTHLSILLLL